MATAIIRDPIRKFKFTVNITGGGYNFTRLGFNRVSGLNVEYEETKYREGGDAIVERSLPGLMKFENITLERGVMADDADLWEAFTLAAQGNPNFRFEVIITLYDPITNEPARSWVVHRAWVQRYEEDELDASSSEVLIERIVLAHEGFDRLGIA